MNLYLVTRLGVSIFAHLTPSQAAAHLVAGRDVREVAA